MRCMEADAVAHLPLCRPGRGNSKPLDSGVALLDVRGSAGHSTEMELASVARRIVFSLNAADCRQWNESLVALGAASIEWTDAPYSNNGAMGQVWYRCRP